MKGVLWLALLTCLGICNAEAFNVSNTLNKILEGYDKRIRPNWGGPPVEVGVTMYFLRVFDVCTTAQTVKTDSYFRQSWVDPRLAFDAPPGVNFIILGSEAAGSFWKPDTFCAEGSAKFAHDGNIFFRINRDGSVLCSVRVLTETSFPMDLSSFPMDKQTLVLSVESYGSTARDITYKWQKPDGLSVGMAPDIGNPDFAIGGDKIPQKEQNIQLSSGNYSRLQVLIPLVRQGQYYVRHFYFPAITSFLLLWSSFWFPVSSTVTRTVFIMTSFLTGNYLIFDCWRYLPATSSSTMLEEYLIFGLIMTIIAVVEYALIVYLHCRAHNATDLESCVGSNQSEGDVKPHKEPEVEKKPNSYLVRSTQYVMSLPQHRRSYIKVDIFFRVVYPLIFLIYNIWYWVSFP